MFLFFAIEMAILSVFGRKKALILLELNRSSSSMKQKLGMIDTVIRLEVGYMYYLVSYFISSIQKFDKQIIKLTKNICKFFKFNFHK